MRVVPRLEIVCLSMVNSDSGRVIECGTFLGTRETATVGIPGVVKTLAN